MYCKQFPMNFSFKKDFWWIRKNEKTSTIPDMAVQMLNKFTCTVLISS